MSIVRLRKIYQQENLNGIKIKTAADREQLKLNKLNNV